MPFVMVATPTLSLRGGSKTQHNPARLGWAVQGEDIWERRIPPSKVYASEHVAWKEPWPADPRSECRSLQHVGRSCAESGLPQARCPCTGVRPKDSMYHFILFSVCFDYSHGMQCLVYDAVSSKHWFRCCGAKSRKAPPGDGPSGEGTQEVHTRGKMTGTIPQSNHPTGKILLAFVRCGSETMIEQGLEASADQANLPNCSGMSGSTWGRAGHGWLSRAECQGLAGSVAHRALHHCKTTRHCVRCIE